MSPPLPDKNIAEGMDAHRRGDFRQALLCYEKTLAAQPDHAIALNLKGTALFQCDQPEQALPLLQRAAQLRRNDAGILGNLGQVYLALDKHVDAEQVFRKALRLEPNQPDYQMGVANALALQGKLSDAEVLFTRLAQRHPHQPLPWFNLGNVQRDQGRAADAIESFRHALALDANALDARNNLAGALHALLRFDDAEREYRACLVIDPDYLPARISLASLLIDVARDAEAEVVCREVLQCEPGHIDAWLMLANAQNHQGRIEDQLHTMRAAATRARDNVKVIKACAGALFDAGYFAEAMREVARAQAIEPDETARQDLLAGALLAYGYIEAAWICYRHRPGPALFRAKNPQVMLSNRLPGEVKGAHIFVQREQGLGDELFFLRYAPLLARRGARITYRAGRKLHTLLERVTCLATVLPESAPVPAADAVLLVGDLPHALTPGDIAQRQFADVCATAPAQTIAAGRWMPYRENEATRFPPGLAIPPLPARIDDMRQRLASVGAPPYLGLTWRAGVPPREQGADGWTLYKSAAIDGFAKAAGAFPGTLLALQRGPLPGEIAAFAQVAGRPVHDFSDLNDDLEGMLALLALIDDYAGVSNTNMHLRIAAGKTARVLVPGPAEWRWMVVGDTSPWFPGFSLYRQATNGDWVPAWNALALDLAQTPPPAAR